MRMMKAFAYLGDGTAGWVEKPIPQPTGFDGVIRPLLVSPCTSDVHNVEIDCLKPGRILGHEGLGEIVAVGEGVKEFQVGELVVVPPVTPDWRTVPSQLGAHQHCAGLITGQKLSNSEDGLLAEYALIRDLDANAARIPPGVSPEGAVMAADMLNTGLYGAELAEVRPGDAVVVMGVGPVVASRNAMKKAGVTIDDIDLIEANEAFAAQSIAVARELHFDMSKVNVNGGAIALGHPVGASGARIIVTLLHEMQKRPEAKRGLATLCIGGGMGVATIYEKC